MPNTKSAKKALRSSLRKKQYNNFWKNQIKLALKALENKLETKKAEVDILNADLTVLQKALDKAAKNNVIHRNKANRIKSRYAKKITVQAGAKPSEHIKKESSKKGAKSKAAGKPKS